MKVLIVEDIPDQAHLLSEQLQRLGFDCHMCFSALTVIQDAIHMEVDIIVTDLRMPDMDGFEFIKIIREVDKSIPIVVITAYASEESKNESFRIGADYYLTKPVLMADLKRIFKQWQS